jgi:hypothetical protein
MQAETSCGSKWVLTQHYHGGFLCRIMTKLGLLLAELGCYLLSPAQAPARAKW